MADIPSGATPDGAVLALWNDIDPARGAEYERWHTREHVPERVWVPGFRSGTRYERLSGEGARWFTLYAFDSLAPLASKAYQDLVHNPTPWSASMRPAFRNFLRRIYTVDSGAGEGIGSVLMVARTVWDAARDDAPSHSVLNAFAHSMLRESAAGCAMRVQVGLATTAGPQALANVDDAPDGVERLFMLHATNSAHLARLMPVFADVAARMLTRPLWHRQACYSLASHVLHAEVAQPKRPAPRLDLMP